MNSAHYIKVLNESQIRLNKALKNAISVLAKENIDNKQNALNSLYEEIKHFKMVLPKEDYPEWLTSIERSIAILHSDKISDTILANILETLIVNAYQCLNKSWESDDVPCFEEIYLAYRNASRINEYFDLLIDQLNKLITEQSISEEIIQNGIQRIIEVINKNKGKSLYSDKSLLTWVVVFLKNVAVSLVKEIPGVKNVIEGIEKTLNELNDEIKNTTEKTSNTILSSTKINVSLFYNKDGEKIIYEDSMRQIKLLA